MFSGIALNRGVGGVNPGAVELALQQGAKVVWMPTLDAANHAAAFGAGGTYGFKAMTLTSRRKGKDPLYSVSTRAANSRRKQRKSCELVVDFDAILATGHISKQESSERGIRAQHWRQASGHHTPGAGHPKLDLPTMIELAKAGAYMEFCAVNLLPMFYSISLQGLIEAIEAVTPERTILSSDGGQPFNPRPHEAIRIVIQSLYEKGLPTDAIQTICIENQKKLLNLRAHRRDRCGGRFGAWAGQSLI